MATKRTEKKRKDLAPKSGTVKGGGGNLEDKLATNDNITLLRGAKPAAKRRDLPSRKDVKGGKKVA